MGRMKDLAIDQMNDLLNADPCAVHDIYKEKWRKAPGVKAPRGETNDALAFRKYDVDCHTPHRIVTIKGYCIWWCSAHHQPSFMCELDQERWKLSQVESALSSIPKE